MKIFDYLNKHKRTINLLLIAALILLGVHIYNLLTSLYISVEFKELRPMHEKVNVYYKGLKVGKVTQMHICHDCKSTIVKLRLSYKGLKLPLNTQAILKKEKKKNKEFDFIELVYPKAPSEYLLSNGCEINGKSTTDIETYMANRDPDELEQIKQNLLYSSENLNNALAALYELITTLDNTVRTSQKNIYNSSVNLANTTKNINDITGKFNDALKQDRINSSVSSVNTSLNNLTETTSSFNTTMPRVDAALYQAQSVLCNVNEITCGIKETMKKPFGGLRILFGKSIQSKKY